MTLEYIVVEESYALLSDMVVATPATFDARHRATSMLCQDALVIHIHLAAQTLYLNSFMEHPRTQYITGPNLQIPLHLTTALPSRLADAH